MPTQRRTFSTCSTYTPAGTPGNACAPGRASPPTGPGSSSRASSRRRWLPDLHGSLKGPGHHRTAISHGRCFRRAADNVADSFAVSVIGEATHRPDDRVPRRSRPQRCRADRGACRPTGDPRDRQANCQLRDGSRPERGPGLPGRIHSTDRASPRRTQDR